MNCIHPITAFDTGLKSDSGKRVITFKPPKDIIRANSLKEIIVPCGKCSACLANRRNNWVNRMMCELFSAGSSSFVTLTFDPKFVPSTLRKSDIQKFIKRLRHASRDYGVPPFNLRYFACGEYGKKHHRPHYHLILFGVDILNNPFWKSYVCGCTNGRVRYSSKVLESIWPYGFVVVGDCNYSSIRYVSKYITKQYQSISNDDVPPFTLKSQGLGRSLFIDVQRNGRKNTYHVLDTFKDYYPNGFIVLPSVRGYEKLPLPRVLDDYAEKFLPSLYLKVKESRLYHALNSFDDVSPRARANLIDYKLRAELMKGELDNE